MKAITSRNTTAAPIDKGSAGATPNSSARTQPLSANAGATPRATPAAICRVTRAASNATMSDPAAPMATRIPMARWLRHT